MNTLIIIGFIVAFLIGWALGARCARNYAIEEMNNKAYPREW